MSMVPEADVWVVGEDARSRDDDVWVGRGLDLVDEVTEEGGSAIEGHLNESSVVMSNFKKKYE